MFVPDCSGTIEGFPVRVWNELPTSALVIPVVRFTDAGLPRTVLVVGLSDRLPWNGVYQAFLRECAHPFAVLTADYASSSRRITPPSRRTRTCSRGGVTAWPAQP